MTLVAALFGRRDQRRDKPPFRVRQIARIPQSAPLVAPAIFDRPHRRPPNQAASLESQPIPPNQDVLGQTLSPSNLCAGPTPGDLTLSRLCCGAPFDDISVESRGACDKT